MDASLEYLMKGGLELPLGYPTIQPANNMAESTVSTLPPELSRWNNLLSGVVVPWVMLLVYHSILFGYIVAKTWKTRCTTRIPLMELVFRDGKSQSTTVSWLYRTFNTCCRRHMLCVNL
jgi:hypothetical protein